MKLPSRAYRFDTINTFHLHRTGKERQIPTKVNHAGNKETAFHSARLLSGIISSFVDEFHCHAGNVVCALIGMRKPYAVMSRYVNTNREVD